MRYRYIKQIAEQSSVDAAIFVELLANLTVKLHEKHIDSERVKLGSCALNDFFLGFGRNKILKMIEIAVKNEFVDQQSTDIKDTWYFRLTPKSLRFYPSAYSKFITEEFK